MKITLIIVGALLVIWLLWSYFGTRAIETPKILSTTTLKDWVKIYEVAPMIQATVVVTWSQSDAINNGFRQLAGYIFGSNTVKEPIAMTAPVALTKSNTDTNTTIAMTAPVALQKTGDTYTVSFMMPSKYTLDTLPKATNTNISFTELPSKKYYVWTFSFYANQKRATAQLFEFMKALTLQWIKTDAEPILNQYNDPWTIPFMRKNELWIEVK